MQDVPSPEDMAEVVASYMIKEKISEAVEYSVKTKSFRLKISPVDVPADVATALRGCTKESSTVFAGKIGVKVRLLSARLLSTDTLAQLRALTVTHKFSDWAEKYLDRRDATQRELAKAFCKLVER